MKNSYLGYFGAFTWAGAAVKRLADFAEKCKFEVVNDPVEIKHAMKECDIAKAEELARSMAEKLNSNYHKTINHETTYSTGLSDYF